MKEVQTPKENAEEVITIIYSYKNGRLVTEDYFEGQSKAVHENTVFQYDDRGELIRAAEYRNGELHSEVDYAYFE